MTETTDPTPARRWLHPQMEEWARKEHIRYLRGLILSGFAVIAWGAYNLSAAVIGAGLAMIAVGFWFWRLAPGKAEVKLFETTFSGTQTSATTQPAAQPPLPTADQQAERGLSQEQSR